MAPHTRRGALTALALASCVGLAGPLLAAPAPTPDPKLVKALDSPLRTGPDKARDVFRHPAQSLTFWGLAPGDTVIDISPGSGWWTDILAPYLAATGGHYIAAGPDLNDPKTSAGARKGVAAFQAKYGADPKVYGDVKLVGFGPASGPLAPAGTVDLVLVSREIHNWPGEAGFTHKAFADFYAALKPGGFVAVEDHRAPDGADPRKGDGYVSEAYVIAEATKAGFRLDGRSEINANPKDTKDYPFGVWTLPPTRRTSPFGQPANPAFDRSRYDAIGESDRMTLRFVKPGDGA
jgi:predicted methyltransferase